MRQHPAERQRSRVKVAGRSGRRGEGDGVAEGFELADVVAGGAVFADALVVVAGAEVVVAGGGVGEQVPDDDQDGAGDRDEGLELAAAPGQAPLRAPDWMVRGHILTQDTRWAAVGKTLMCRPISAMSAWALSRPMPVTSSRRFTAGSTGAAGPVPAWGPVVPSAFTPWAAGMAAISSSIRAVSLPIWADRASTWSSSIRASSAWWSSNRPVSASIRAARLAFIFPRARSASIFGSRSPPISASIMSRTDSVPIVLATAEILISASS